MVTIVIVSILLTIAVPSFRDLMIKSRLSGQVQEFYGVISFARSEAIKRGNYVSICKSADGSSCGGNWSDGWIVFANNDNDSPAVVDGGETLLRVFPALPNGDTLNANNNFTNYVTFDRFGMANNVGTFVFCANSDESKARAIVVTKTRPRIATDTDGNGIPDKEDGTEITSCENP
jgi:type IV fimbrial biogenesis protein FimT